MLGRLTLCLSILLLLPLPVARAATEESKPAIVLQLPPGMSADEVRQLVGGLQAKGAALQEQAEAPAEDEPLVRRILTRIRQAAPGIREAPTLPDRWHAALEAEHRSGDGFWLKLAGVLAVALAIEFAIRAGLTALPHRLRIEAGIPLHRAFVRHFVSLAAGLVGFIIVMRFGGALLGQDSQLLTATTMQVVDSTIRWRIATAFLALLVAPDLPAARPLLLDDDGARRVSRWVGGYLIFWMAFIPGIWLVERIGDADLELDTAVGLGFLSTVYKIVMFFRLRAPIAGGILAGGGEHPRPMRRFAAAFWHWAFIALAVAVFVLAVIQYVVDHAARSSAAAVALQAFILAVSLAWAAKQRFIAEHARHTPAHWWRPLVNRAIDMIVLIGGFVWLAGVWGYDPLDPGARGIAVTVLRPILRATITLALTWLIWSTISGFLRERAPHPSAPADADENAEAGMTRLATLLPLIRNTLAITIFLLGAMIALGDLGVNIGPLLAGAGVVGIALGFGAQALVRDVIAGLFFLIDDAFRLGEYIDTGRLKGTVEAISIRSLRLRHQNGQIHTIPFGQIQAVTNSSRDWAIIKFNLHIAPESDLELVRKTVKQLGLALLEDPEIGGDFIQPLKMQGVADVTKGAIMIRCKFTARPLRPSYLRRQAMRQIIERFAVAGIVFAQPPQTASNPL
ncbi:MAG TPA: mechanosensitive ion channel family protein [Aliidongia sp.]|nr:mechanosensitive ion channel family protein [Aliidongia sp.]